MKLGSAAGPARAIFFRCQACLTLQFICDEEPLEAAGSALDPTLGDVIDAVLEGAAKAYAAHRFSRVADKLSAKEPL